MIFYILFHHIIIVKLQILSLRRNLKKESIDDTLVYEYKTGPYEGKKLEKTFL